MPTYLLNCAYSPGSWARMMRTADDRVEARLHAVRLDQQHRIGGAGGDRGKVADPQDFADIGAPGYAIAVDVPAVERLADRRHNVAAGRPIQWRRQVLIARRAVAHRRLFLVVLTRGRCQRWLL